MDLFAHLTLGALVGISLVLTYNTGRIQRLLTEIRDELRTRE